MKEPDLDALLQALRRKKAIAFLLQVRARIRELGELVDFLEEQPEVLLDMLNELDEVHSETFEEP